MRLAISNIAWDVSEDLRIAKLLNQFDIDAIDIAPSKYFPDFQKSSDRDIAKVRKWWADFGIEITGMQALMFGTSDLNVFGDVDIRTAMLDHLRAVCRIGAGLGATRLVFGSPKNRDRINLNDDQTGEIAVEFFRQLGDIAQTEGVLICLEPNPSRYGANFMTSNQETIEVVTAINHPAIKMQFDTGSMAINQESHSDVLLKASRLIGHVHASEPDLLPLGDGGADHTAMAAALAQHLPTHVVSIEMIATKTEPHHVSIERAVKCAIQHYRNANNSKL